MMFSTSTPLFNSDSPEENPEPSDSNSGDNDSDDDADPFLEDLVDIIDQLTHPDLDIDPETGISLIGMILQAISDMLS